MDAAAAARPEHGFHEDFDEPIPGHEQGEVEYELLREEWVTAARGGYPSRHEGRT